jgi:WD40 repeat protein
MAIPTRPERASRDQIGCAKRCVSTAFGRFIGVLVALGCLACGSLDAVMSVGWARASAPIAVAAPAAPRRPVRPLFLDVPIEIRGAGVARDRRDFVFLTDEGTSRSFLGTLRAARGHDAGRLTCYAFEVAGGRLGWTGQTHDAKDRRAIAVDARQATLVTRSTDRLLLAHGFTWKFRRVGGATSAATSPEVTWKERELLRIDHATAQVLAVDGSFASGRYALTTPSPRGGHDLLSARLLNDGTRLLRHDFDAFGASLFSDDPRRVRVSAMTFLPERKSLVVSYEGCPSLAVVSVDLDRATGLPDYRKLEHETPVQSWDVSADGTLLVSVAHSDGVKPGDCLRFWDPRAAFHLRAIDERSLPGGTCCVALGRSRVPILATGHDNGSVLLWRYDRQKSAGGNELDDLTLTLEQTLPHVGPVVKVAFSGDGRVLAALGIPRENSPRPPGTGSTGPLGQVRVWPCEGLVESR